MLPNWNDRFPDCEPIAHRLRTAFPARWVRFHSLPQSKRYPEDEAEYRTVLERHNGILGELLGSERKVVLLTTGDSETPDFLPEPELRALDPDAKLWRSVPMQDLDGFADPGYHWHVFASEWEWSPGLFNPVVWLVADDVVRNVMVVAPDCRWLLHPYDGGMDVILESPAARDFLRAAHRGWLSPRPDGL